MTAGVTRHPFSIALVAAAAAGALAAGLAAAVSYGSAVGALPAWIYGRANVYSILIRIGDVPIEFFAFAWFAGVAAAAIAARRGDGASRVFTYIFLTAMPVAGYGLWLVWARRTWIWPLAASAAAALIVLIVSAAASSPAALRQTAPADLRRWLASPRARAFVLAWLAFTGLGAQAIGAAVRRVPADVAGARGFTAWFRAQSRVAAIDGSARRELQVVIYTDYECPACQANVPTSLLALDVMRREHPLPIHVSVRDFPLERECNSAVRDDTHPQACEAAAAVRFIAERVSPRDAEDAGVAFYRTRGAVPREKIAGELRARNLEADFSREYPRLVDAIRREAGEGAAMGVRATPSIYVNGIRLRSSTLLRRAIAEETARLAASGG